MRKRKAENTTVVSKLPNKRARTYDELESVLKDIGKVQQGTENHDNILEILFCCKGVKLYYIEANGEVVSSLEEFVLRIIRLGSDFEKNLDETIFLQLIKTSETSIEIGQEVAENGESSSSKENEVHEQQQDPSFVYPLIPGVSPLFRTKFHAFVLPDLQSNDGSAIGMMVPSEFDDIVLDILVTILQGVVKEDGEIEFGDFTKIGEPSKIIRSTGDKVSENIVCGAFWISKGLVKSAQKTGEFIDYSTPYILSKMQKAEDPEPVSDKVNTSVTVAKSVTGYAAQGTSFLAEKVGCAMNSFGRFLAPHVQYQGAKLLSYTVGMEAGQAEVAMTESLKIASGAAEAISTIYGGLESSTGILGRKLADNSVKAIKHKYGESYGEVSEKGFDTVGNLWTVKNNFNILSPKCLAKLTNKSAAKGILNSDEIKPKMLAIKDVDPSLFPNLQNFSKDLSKSGY